MEHRGIREVRAVNSRITLRFIRATCYLPTATMLAYALLTANRVLCARAVSVPVCDVSLFPARRYLAPVLCVAKDVT